MRSALDTNVISALWSGEPASAHAEKLLLEAHHRGSLLICGVVYAELIGHPSVEPAFVDTFLRQSFIDVDVALTLQTWREAGIRFARYAARRSRAKGGPPRRLIADFLIGAHALYAADRLITFNGADFRVDFPDLTLTGS